LAEIYIRVFKFKLNKCLSFDNDQLDAHLLYFTIFPLQPSTCFEHYMLIIRTLNCIDAASGIILSVSGRPVHRTATDWDTRRPLCIKLVIVKAYTKMNGQQNIKKLNKCVSNLYFVVKYNGNNKKVSIAGRTHPCYLAYLLRLSLVAF